MDGKLILTGEEIAAMRAIDSAVALGQSTEKIADVPQRLFEQGVVEKSESGGLVLTGRGRKLLRASNLQG
jgi:Mn-dependent DtxR family transcriptional regulator